MIISRLIFIFFVLQIQLLSYSQIDTLKLIVEDKSKFKIIMGKDFQGAIVPKEIGAGFNNEFTPTLKEIVLAENGFSEQYNQCMSSVIEEQSKIDNSRVYHFKRIKNVRGHFKNYVRQYVGYTDNQNNRIIWINLVCIERLQKACKTEFDWRNRIIRGLGDPFYENSASFEFNIGLDKLKEK